MPPSPFRPLSPARSSSLASAFTPPPVRTWKCVVTHAVLMIHVAQAVLWTLPAQAQTVAASAAPSGQKALMDAAANGTPIAHIAPPGASGVSRNQYDQFNVTGKGLILNNSSTNVQTVQGGWITGNLQLGPTPARIILNEVVSTNPSTLRGTIEVAGQRADIVVANPNGIACDGCGFLNANRATLTTGQVQFGSGGAINGLDVRQGALGIGAAGLNASNLEQLDLIARGLVIDGEVWAKNLNVIAGANQVLYGTLSAAAQSGTGATPRFAIDIKDLGGMYANQIVLVASDKGLGVNSTGRLAALQGNLALSANGDLTLRDSYAAQAIRIDGQANTTLTGTTQSGAATTISSAGAITQQGTLDAQGALVLSATDIRNQGAIIQRGAAGAAGTGTTLTASGTLDNSGTVYSGAGLVLQSTTLTDTNGTLQALGDITVTARSATLSGTQLSGQGAINLAAGALNASATRIQTPSSLRITGNTVANNGGVWQAGQDLSVQAGTFGNTGGTLASGGRVGVNVAGALDNTNGILSGNGGVQIVAGSVGNNGGLVQANGRDAAIAIQTGAMSNRSGVIATAGNLAITASALDNRDGLLRAEQTARIALGTGQLDNSAGQLIGAGALTLESGAIRNAGGVLASGSVLALDTQGQQLDNTSGAIIATGPLRIVASALTSNGGQLVAQGRDSTVTLQADSLANRSGVIDAAGSATITANAAIDNVLGTIRSGTNAASTAGMLSLTAGSLANAGGQTIARDALQITTGALGNANGVIASRDAGVGIAAAALVNTAGLITGNTTTLSTQAIDNAAGEISGTGALSINANGQTIDNGNGQLLGGSDLRLQAGRLSNTGSSGTIAAGRDIAISATTLNNDGARLSAGRDLVLTTSGNLTNRTGSIEAVNALTLAAGALDTSAGKLLAGRTVNITAGSINATDGTISAADTVTLETTGALTNRRGKISADGNLAIAAATLDNRDGAVSAKQSTDINLGTGVLDNAAGQLIGSGALTLRSGEIRNAGGTIASGSTLALNTQGHQLDNSANGQLVAQRDVTITSAALGNAGGTIAALQGALVVNTGTSALDNTGGMLQASGNADLTGGTLGNRAGRIVGRDITLTGTALDNHDDGRIVAASRLTATTQGIRNDTGLLQAVGAVTLDTGDGVLTNTSSGSSGGIIAGTTLAITGGDLANQGGFIASNGAQTIRVVRDIDNRSGQLVSGADSTITVRNLDNGSGRITAAGNVTLAGTGLIDNRAGQIAANGSASITAATLRNAASGTIEANDINLNATTVDNAGGAIRAQRNLSLVTTALDNTNATLSARNDLSVSAGSLANSGGNITSNGNAALTTGSPRIDGTVSAQNLTLTLQNGSGLTDLTNSGLLSAQNNLTINAANLTNSGTLAAGAVLTANTSGNLRNSGEISASTTRLNVAGTLTNTVSGLIDGVTTTINAGATDNTGRIYGDQLAINGSAVNNRDTGTVAARQTLLLGAQAVSNTGGALLYSLGDIAIGARIDGAGQLQGAASTLVNASSRIEAAGTLSVDAASIVNRNDQLTTRTVTSAPVLEEYVIPRDSTTQYPLSQCTDIGGSQDSNACIVHPDLFGLRSTVTTARTITPAVTGGDSPTPATTQINYSWDAPVFARFAVTPVGPPPAEPSGGCTTTNFDGAPVPLYTSGCNTWRTQYASWDSSFQATLDQLETKIATYNAGVNEDNRVETFEDYTRIRVSGITSTTEVATSAPAQLLSGGAMRLTGDTSNRDSQIVAGGALAITSSSLPNDTTKGEKRTTFSGTSQFSEVVYCSPFNTCRETQAQIPYDKAPNVKSFNLPTTQRVQFAANPTAVRDLTRNTTAPISASAGSIGSVATTPASLNPNGAISAQLRPALAVVNASGSTQPISAPPAQSTLVLKPVAPGGAVVPVSPQQVSTSQGNAFIVTAQPSQRPPATSLFTIHPAPDSRTLVETDPRFTNQRAFLGSDYFLQALQRNPERQLKRYGDGFAEQQLVNDQILTLTERRFLSGYSSTETEYQALMDSGVAFARKYQLTPGVALSAEQMALLTTDIVWLSTQNVTLADGTVQQVLAPQVFLRRLKDGDLTPTGALIAGSDVTIRTDRDLVNSGTIAASGKLTLVAGRDLVNDGGRLSGQDIVARASNDLKNLSGVIQGSGTDSRVTLLAGRDVVIQTRTIDTANTSGNSTRSAIDRVATVQGGTVRIDAARDLLVAGASVGASSDLIATAGGDLRISSVDQHYQIAVGDSSGRTVQGRSGHIVEDNVTQAAATLVAGGNLALVAGGNLGVRGATVSAGDSALLKGANVTIDAAKERTTTDIQTIGKNAYNHVARSDETLVGGSISATNDLSVIANGRDGAGNIAVNAGYLSSKAGLVGVVAGNDIAIGAITTARSAINDSYNKSGNLVSSTTTTSSQRSSSDQVQGSVLSGNTILAQAGNPTNRTGDISIAGSSLVADRDLRLDAGRDLTITTAQSTQQDSSAFQQTTSGLFTSGAALTLGQRQQQQDATGTATTSAASTVASLSGNARLIAGQRYTQTGSDLLTPNGNIDVTARKIDITAATDTAEQRQQQQFKQSGLTVAVSNPVISAAQTAQQMTAAAGQTKDVRMQALAAATTVLAASKAVDAVTDPDKATSIGVSISLGGSKSQSDSTQRSSTVRGSTIAAGGDVTLRSLGDKGGNNTDSTDGNILLSGSQISAGRDARLLADGKIDLGAASNTAAQTSTNNSSSASVGIGFSVGANTGFYISANAAAARGKADGSDVTQVNSQVEAGNRVTLKSGGDTTLDGAVVRGRQVTGDIGGNLVIASRQDTSVFAGKQQSASAGITVPIGPGTGGGNLSASKSKVDSTFASVAEQSGIQAGDGGFNVNVAGNTTLTGGAITSTQKAMDDDVNRFTTGGTLTTSDIQNRASYNATSVGVTLGAGADSSGKSTLGGSSAGIGRDSGNASSVTAAAISGIAGNKAARTGDAGTGMQKIFDADKLQKDVNAQVQITQAFGREAPKAIADFAAAQALDFRGQRNEEEAKKWDEGGIYRVALHTATGALTGGTSGALGAAAVAGAAPLLNDLQDNIAVNLKNAGASDTVAKLAGQLIAQSTAVGLGAVASGGATAGTAMGLNVDANNRQLHPTERILAQQLAKQSGGKYTAAQIEAQMRGMTMTTDGVIEVGVPDTVVSGLPKRDQGGTWIYAGSTADGKPIVVQQLDPADAALRAYIVSNTTGASVPSLVTYGGSYVAPPLPTLSNGLPAAPDGTTRISIVVDGTSYFPLVARCPAASCTNGDSIASAIPDPGTKAFVDAVARKVDKTVNIVTAVTGVAGEVAAAVKAVTAIAGAGAKTVQVVEGEVVGAVQVAKGAGSGMAPVKSVGANSDSLADAASSMQAARLTMQLSAEQAAGVRAPTSIASYSDHALKQIAVRDAGIGVNQTAVIDAFANPVTIQYVPSKYGPTFKYTGQNATVVVSPQGNVVTTWGTSAAGVAK
ncbi:hemagglutinin repeat-containing protein [Actimicrobium sp. CCI2.3]|uniref:two-partner secretion domain-containing protein n=1 Tax=Actimicrobium sp. CCI2.3 TaxID=3048616 RepID=UPI002AB45199|nr:hemagglutinin repeat-containing protein [Actimicrobium sp. CCI2.3]MDY7575174.1 hemagglutinin repeat-containing protein [Actimicrobium sp. CCI2.3]MEB0022363.1 hemagglutinin repeat-containing protein [Actimicrobium sp. CCI2.3]